MNTDDFRAEIEKVFDSTFDLTVKVAEKNRHSDPEVNKKIDSIIADIKELKSKCVASN